MSLKNSCEYADCAMDEIDMLVNSNIAEHGPQHRPAFWGRLRVVVLYYIDYLYVLTY